MTEWEQNARELAKFACPFEKNARVKIPATISTQENMGIVLEVFPLVCPGQGQGSPAIFPLYTLLLDLDNGAHPLHIVHEEKLRDLSIANGLPYISGKDIIQSANSRRPVALARIALGNLVRLYETGEEQNSAAGKINLLYVKRLFDKYQTVDTLVRNYTKAVLQKGSAQDKDSLQLELNRRERIAQKIAESACPFSVGDELLIPGSTNTDYRVLVTNIRPTSFRNTANQFLYELELKMKIKATSPQKIPNGVVPDQPKWSMDALEIINGKKGIKMNDLYTI